MQFVPIALLVAMLAFPDPMNASPPTPKAKGSKNKTTKSKAKKKERAVSDPAWAAMMDRDVVVAIPDGVIRGRLAGHDDETATVVADDGTLTVVEKDDVSELRADLEAKKAPPPPPSSGATNPRGPRPEDNGPEGFRRRGQYVHGSPGAVLFPFSSPDLIAYRWGFAVGDFKPRSGSRFAAAYGFAFDHAFDHQNVIVATFDPLLGVTTTTDVSTWTHILRPMAEIRLGGSNPRVFAYGLIGTGLTLFVVNADAGEGVRDSDTQISLCAPIGAGVQGLIGKRFIVGFEPRVVLDLAIAAVFDAKFLIGAKF